MFYQTPNPRGFASLSPERRREAAASGGRRAHQLGRAHRFDRKEARAAGRKGGRSTSRDREHMAAIGRQGGVARMERRQRIFDEFIAVFGEP